MSSQLPHGSVLNAVVILTIGPRWPLDPLYL
jgi:hypothetical protein